MDKQNSFDIEQGFSRLEQILEKMHSGNLSLKDSLKLYEEADQLIVSCSTCLNEAEQKIEMLVKNRNGELMLDANQRPLTQDFPNENSTGLNYPKTHSGQNG